MYCMKIACFLNDFLRTYRRAGVRRKVKLVAKSRFPPRERVVAPRSPVRVQLAPAGLSIHRRSDYMLVLVIRLCEMTLHSVKI